MRQRLKRISIALAALIPLWSAPTFAAPRYGGVTELYLYPYIQYSRWKEEDPSLKIGVRESGPLYGFGTAVGLNLLQTETAGSLRFRGKGEIFGGVIDYDGQTQPAQPLATDTTKNDRPVKTDVTYIGFKAESMLGWRLGIEKIELEPFAGVGYKWWSRDIYDSTAIDTNNKSFPVSGYTELWQTIYTKLGMAAGYRMSDSWRIFAEAGAKYPLYNSNTAGLGDVTVRPKSRWSAFAEIGFRYRQFRPALYYEGYRIDKSPAVQIDQSHAILQPRSTEDVVGISVGYCFR